MNNQHNQKERDRILTLIVETLNSKTSWKELQDLEKAHRGITIKYWRICFPHIAKWPDFLSRMEERFFDEYWPEEAVSEDVSPEKVIEIANKLTKPFVLDVDAMIAKIVKES